jgi:hypothetical protein
MALRPRAAYPTFPASCWWPLRERFKRALPPTISAEYLQAVLEVEPKTARNLVPMLRQMGFIDDAGALLPRANEWRVDVEYREICRAIAAEIYPDALRHAVPHPGSDFDAAVRWFMKASGVGVAAAKRMARFYALLMKGDPREGQARLDRPASRPDGAAAGAVQRRPVPTNGHAPSPKNGAFGSPASPADGITVQSIDLGAAATSGAPVQLVIQIQLPPGATAEQIDQLIASIARHLGPSASRGA